MAESGTGTGAGNRVLLNRAYWGNGYAIEAATACKKYAFERLEFNEVFSTVRDTNVSSMNVAIRNGMVVRDRFIKHYCGIDMPHFLFGVRKDVQ
jgi:RimJ/RimL family protein N-acetyltransferase